MTDTTKCPECGSEARTRTRLSTRYDCGTIDWVEDALEQSDYCLGVCAERARNAADVERLTNDVAEARIRANSCAAKELTAYRDIEYLRRVREDLNAEVERLTQDNDRLRGLLVRARWFVDEYDCYPLDDHPERWPLLCAIDAALELTKKGDAQ